MKLTKQQLQTIIKEEIQKAVNEYEDPVTGMPLDPDVDPYAQRPSQKPTSSVSPEMQKHFNELMQVLAQIKSQGQIPDDLSKKLDAAHRNLMNDFKSK